VTRYLLATVEFLVYIYVWGEP